jgi:peptide/nickel transport system substrate-binding protein
MVWYGNPDFYWGYDNPTVTRWLNQAGQATSDAQHTKLMKKVAKKIAEDAASDWLYLYPQLVVSSTKLSGYPVNGLNSQFFVYRIEKTK